MLVSMCLWNLSISLLKIFPEQQTGLGRHLDSLTPDQQRQSLKVCVHVCAHPLPSIPLWYLQAESQ